jgi:hypothetical protein
MAGVVVPLLLAVPLLASSIAPVGEAHDALRVMTFNVWHGLRSGVSPGRSS